MPKSIRIKTTPGKDQNIQLELKQDFDLLEILSLKMSQGDVYSRMCADFGVVVGRVLANSGFGVPNAKVSIFIPLTDEDENNPLITDLYPYKDVADKNEEGYKYNLLPRIQSHERHSPTGSFPELEEFLSNPTALEVYEKYYKFTVRTNSSGDFMIWGVPLGNHTIHMDVDVGDIGCYSMKPFDFIAQGFSEEQFNNAAQFKSSENLDSLPQIVMQNKNIEVTPFWGDDELCGIGITRVDFDLRDAGVEIKPTAIFVGSIISDNRDSALGVNCVPDKAQGEVCKLTTGTGRIDAVRFTIFDNDDGSPKLEYFAVGGGKAIDASGSFVTELPMNLDYVVTNEYGEEVFSNDPSKGIPTRAKYRFRFAFDDENDRGGQKARYLVPNLRENMNDIPGSYAFSDDIYDYPNSSNPSDWATSEANIGDDYFYEVFPDKVYTISQFISYYRKGMAGTSSATGQQKNRWKFIGIKSINPAIGAGCSDSTTQFPANDAFRGGNMLYNSSSLLYLLQAASILMTYTLASITLIISLIGFFENSASNAAVTVASIYSLASAWTGNLSGVMSIASMIAELAFIILKDGWQAALWVSFLSESKFNMPLTKYDECDDCICQDDIYAYELPIPNFITSLLTLGGSVDDMAGGQDGVNVSGNNPTDICNITQLGGLPNWFDGTYFDGSCYKVYVDALSSTLSAFAIAVGLGVAASMTGFPALFSAASAMIAIPLVDIINQLYRCGYILIVWRVRKNIYNALCMGILNLSFFNGWINGTLYFFKFKLDGDGGLQNPYNWCGTDLDSAVGGGTGLINSATQTNPDGSDSMKYYYRSTPWNGTQYSSDNGFIYYPTTIMELGSFYDIRQNTLCDDCNKVSSEECFFVDKLERTSYQSNANLIEFLINEKIGQLGWTTIQFTGINQWFGGSQYPGVGNNPRNTRAMAGTGGAYNCRFLDGDITRVICQNNSLGIAQFISPWDTPNAYYSTIGSGNVSTTSNNIFLRVRDADIRTCIVGGTSDVFYKTTQDKPYLTWTTAGSQRNHNWNTSGPSSVENQPGAASLSSGIPYNGAVNQVINSTGGNVQVSPFMSSTSADLAQSTFFHFYFGKNQGSTAYDNFVTKFIPPDETDE